MMALMRLAGTSSAFASILALITIVLPYKTDPPLIVDSNTVLAQALAFQLLQSIAGLGQ
jgi:hypothetical protein